MTDMKGFSASQLAKDTGINLYGDSVVVIDTNVKSEKKRRVGKRDRSLTPPAKGPGDPFMVFIGGAPVVMPPEKPKATALPSDADRAIAKIIRKPVGAASPLHTAPLLSTVAISDVMQAALNGDTLTVDTSSMPRTSDQLVDAIATAGSMLENTPAMAALAWAAVSKMESEHSTVPDSVIHGSASTGVDCQSPFSEHFKFTEKDVAIISQLLTRDVKIGKGECFMRYAKTGGTPLGFKGLFVYDEKKQLFTPQSLSTLDGKAMKSDDRVLHILSQPAEQWNPVPWTAMASLLDKFKMTSSDCFRAVLNHTFNLHPNSVRVVLSKENTFETSRKASDALKTPGVVLKAPHMKNAVFVDDAKVAGGYTFIPICTKWRSTEPIPGVVLATHLIVSTSKLIWERFLKPDDGAVWLIRSIPSTKYTRFEFNRRFQLFAAINSARSQNRSPLKMDVPNIVQLDQELRSTVPKYQEKVGLEPFGIIWEIAKRHGILSPQRMIARYILHGLQCGFSITAESVYDNGKEIANETDCDDDVCESPKPSLLSTQTTSTTTVTPIGRATTSTTTTVTQHHGVTIVTTKTNSSSEQTVIHDELQKAAEKAKSAQLLRALPSNRSAGVLSTQQIKEKAHQLASLAFPVGNEDGSLT